MSGEYRSTERAKGERRSDEPRVPARASRPADLDRVVCHVDHLAGGGSVMGDTEAVAGGDGVGGAVAALDVLDGFDCWRRGGDEVAVVRVCHGRHSNAVRFDSRGVSVGVSKRPVVFVLAVVSSRASRQFVRLQTPKRPGGRWMAKHHTRSHSPSASTRPSPGSGSWAPAAATSGRWGCRRPSPVGSGRCGSRRRPAHRRGPASSGRGRRRRPPGRSCGRSRCSERSSRIQRGGLDR